MVKADEDIGRVKIVDGRYKLSGKFHIPEANQPIFNEDYS